MTKTRHIVVTGYWSPPPEKDPDFTGWPIREDEKLSICKNMKNIPALDEHQDHKAPIGYVQDVWEDVKSGALGASVALYDDEHGIAALKKILSKEYAGFSFGSWSSRDDKYNRTSTHYPRELSLVKKGDLPGARIFKVDVGDRSFVLPQNIQYSANSAHVPKMTTENQTDEIDLKKMPEEEIYQAVKERKERLAREAEAERREDEEFNKMVDTELQKDWEQAIKDGRIEYDERFGSAIDKLMPIKESKVIIKCLASALKGNFSSLEKKRLEMAEASKKGLATEEERKQPTSTEGKRAALFKRPEIAAPAGSVPVETANSADKTPAADAQATKKSRIELFKDPLDPVMRAKMDAKFASDLANARQ